MIYPDNGVNDRAMLLSLAPDRCRYQNNQINGEL